MDYVLLLPGLISAYLVLSGKVRKAFLLVYLPALLLLPESYSLRIPHTPPFSVAEFAIIPIGMIAFAGYIKNRKVSFMDILVVLYFVSLTTSELLHDPLSTNALFFSIGFFVSVLLPYFAGRFLIEPDLRLTTVRRLVLLLLFSAPMGLYEMRMGANPYAKVGTMLLGLNLSTSVQLRAGWGRMGASFTDAEIAGIAFGMIFALNSWLVYMNRIPERGSIGTRLAILEKYRIPGLLILACIFLTQSRGPMGALLAACLVLQIPRYRNTRRASIVVALLLASAIAAEIGYYLHYTNSKNIAEISEQQGSAIYRRQMNEIYPPVAKQGGMFGWGLTGVPVLEGIVSIDNEYLRVWLVQGRFGIIILILISLESVRGLAVQSWQMKAREDRAFAFSMITALVVLWLSIMTVYMGEQLPQLSFLLIGWCQSLGSGAYSEETVQEATSVVPRFAFRRVYQ